MKKSLLLFLLCVSWAGYGQAQPSIQGVVKDNSGQPVPFVNIILKGTAYGAVANNEGNFLLEKIPAGKYTLVASLAGTGKKEISVTVVDNQTTIVPELILSEDHEQLSEVVVTGNRETYIDTKPSTSLRVNADLIEIPQNINIATRQTLRDMGMLSKGEISRISSGVTRSYGGNLDMTLQIRGTNATYGTYRNGVGGPIWWNAQEDANMIERIEFVKGPAGFMLANAEPGGLVNTVTKQPTRENINEISFGVGSFNLMRTAIDLGGEIKKDGPLTYRLNLGYQKNNEFYQFGRFNRVFVCPALTYEFNKNTNVTVEFNYVKAQAQENTHSSISINGDLWALPIDFAINDPNLDPFIGADVYTRVHLQHKLNEQWTFNAQAAHMTTDWDGTALYLEGISPTNDTLYRASSLSEWWGELYNAQLFLDGKFNTGSHVEHKVLVGIDFGDGGEGSTFGGTWGENKFPLAIDTPTYYLPKDSLRYTGETGSWMSANRWMALYVQDHMKLFDKFILTIAGRFTSLTTGQDWRPSGDLDYEVVDTKFTPRLGLTYLLRKNLSIYILHDESFLAQRGFIYGEGRLPALTGSNNEAGVKALLADGQLSINASVYDIKKNNVGTTDQVHEGYYLKTGQIRSTGFDFDINGRVNTNLAVILNYSYVDARITEDVDETMIGLTNNGTAAHLGNAWIKYQVNAGVFAGLAAGAGMQYTGKRSGVWPGWNSQFGNQYLPDYALFDASISYTVGKFYVGLNVYNLTDKKYASNGSFYPELGNGEWIFDVGTPRNFRLNVIVKL